MFRVRSHRRAICGVSAVLALSGALTASASAHFIGIDSVDDSVRQIRFVESSKYDSAISYAIGQWNGLGSVSISANSSNPTLQVIDYNDPTVSTRGYWDSNPSPDVIAFNIAGLDTPGCGGLPLSEGQRATATHEFGHSLGLAHSFLPNVMHRTCTSGRARTPQAHDREDYFALWPQAVMLKPTAATRPAAVAHSESSFNPEDTRRLVGFSSDVFVATVRGKTGNKGLPTSSSGVEVPQEQFEVDVLASLKGKATGRVAVNQPRTDSEGKLDALRSGETFLFVTRRSSDENWYTLIAPGFSAVDASGDRKRRDVVAKFENAISEQIDPSR